jgi:hypothetical protein
MPAPDLKSTSRLTAAHLLAGLSDMPFNDALQVQLLNDRSVFPFITLQELSYESPMTGETYTVRRHFRTDGSSVPRALILLAPALAMRFMGQGVWMGFREGVLHDYLRRGPNPPVPAHVAHKIFREALYSEGYEADMVEAYYQAVRLFNS